MNVYAINEQFLEKIIGALIEDEVCPDKTDVCNYHFCSDCWANFFESIRSELNEKS